MGHLMLISEDVITAMSRFPPDLRLNIIQYAPEPEWDQFVTGRYNETKQEDNRLLGGGKPVVKSNVPRGVTEWKIDESEMESSASRSASGMKSDFRRPDALNSPSVKQTADFGAASMPMDDEDDTDITPSRAPHVSFSCFCLWPHRVTVEDLLYISSPDILPRK
jgi:serine/threonine-protein phosphatase 6 regulatory subunit 3